MSTFVEQLVGGMYYLTGSRVSLASIVYGFQDGERNAKPVNPDFQARIHQARANLLSSSSR